jgi:hypothetical protein
MAGRCRSGSDSGRREAGLDVGGLSFRLWARIFLESPIGERSWPGAARPSGGVGGTTAAEVFALRLAVGAAKAVGEHAAELDRKAV